MIITFSLVDLESFNNVQVWMNSIYKHKDPSIPKVLVGNKCDLTDERKVTRIEAEKRAEEHNMKYFETSAKEN